MDSHEIIVQRLSEIRREETVDMIKDEEYLTICEQQLTKIKEDISEENEDSKLYVDNIIRLIKVCSKHHANKWDLVFDGTMPYVVLWFSDLLLKADHYDDKKGYNMYDIMAVIGNGKLRLTRLSTTSLETKKLFIHSHVSRSVNYLLSQQYNASDIKLLKFYKYCTGSDNINIMLNNLLLHQVDDLSLENLIIYLQRFISIETISGYYKYANLIESTGYIVPGGTDLSKIKLRNISRAIKLNTSCDIETISINTIPNQLIDLDNTDRRYLCVYNDVTGTFEDLPIERNEQTNEQISFNKDTTSFFRFRNADLSYIEMHIVYNNTDDKKHSVMIHIGVKKQLIKFLENKLNKEA